MYLDTAVFLNVIKREPGFWGPSLQMLEAANRGDIRLLLSTLVLVELAGMKGDVDAQEHDRILDKYLLQNDAITWVDVDISIAVAARGVARRVPLKGGADATHLATAVRHSADYFMSNDGEYPYGETYEHVRVRHPEVIWTETVDDLVIATEVEADGASVTTAGESDR